METMSFTIMDDTDFSEDTTCQQQEDLPYDGDLPQMKICNDYHFTFKNDILGASGQLILTGPDPQDKPTQNKTFQNSAVDMAWDKITKYAIYKNYNKEKPSTMALCVPASKADIAKAHISSILHHRLSKELILRGKGNDCETLPETTNTNSVDEAAVVKNIISHYVKKSCHKEQTSEFTGPPKPEKDGANSKKPSSSLTMTTETTSGLEEPGAVRGGAYQENPHFLTKNKVPSDKEKYSRWQVPRKQLTEKANSSNGFKDSQGQIHHQHLNFSAIVPKVKISKSNTMEKPCSIAKQASFSPTLRMKPMAFQEILGDMSKSNFDSKQHPEKKKKKTEPFQELQDLQGHHEVLDQDFLATKKKHLTLQQQILECESSAMGDFNPERQQNMERKNDRKNCRKCSVIHKKALNQDVIPEFHYRYNTLRQNQNGRGAFIQSCSLDQDKISSPQPKWIRSQRVDSKFIQNECEVTPGKKDLKTFTAYSSDPVPPSIHLHSCRASRSQALCDLKNTEETNPKMLNSALDHALKTATSLKKTTDQMIKDIAEDLVKAQTWRNRLKF
ncbi:protein AKNAD1 isoform 2-T5 [Thomomys bottae]